LIEFAARRNPDFAADLVGNGVALRLGGLVI
jgi:hypothetical protein